MKQRVRLGGWVVLLLAACLLLLISGSGSTAQGVAPDTLLIGGVFDTQNQPVVGATVALHAGSLEAAIPAEDDPAAEPLAQTLTQEDGRFALTVPADLPDAVSLHVERPHFSTVTFALEADTLAALHSGESVVLADLALSRQINAAFWIAAAVFFGVLVLIATAVLHNTLAALLGATLLFAVSYLGHPLSEDLFIFDFAGALGYIDWNVIFLIMGMMIVIAVVERTGIFQWLAFTAYRASGGRVWLLVAILMVVAGVASAVLDNVTTMLLMTPITVQTALALGINPLALLMPEVMASNVAGISTLVGTPTNILIGSYAGLSFNDFLVNLTPGVVLAMVGLVIYSQIVYRRDYAAVSDISPTLLERLEERARITEPGHLRKASWVGLGMLILFVLGEQIRLLPSVTALMGATVLLVWIRPDIEEMIEAVDWTTLVFFMGLFIVVGAIQEVGLISLIADVIAGLVGSNLVLAMVTVTWASALLSTVVANIPFTAAMLPVIGYLTRIVPGAGSLVLFYCLSVGSAMGGNGSLIGASANMVTAGIADRAGFPITYAYFLRKGMPALVVTVGLATLWLVLRFLVFAP
ncbi:MAG: ArsB/NhaD family transporter [Anaerolineae bacterium]|nr:ArsB/NhaD family transporter [Anaerolineae bacterium]